MMASLKLLTLWKMKRHYPVVVTCGCSGLQWAAVEHKLHSLALDKQARNAASCV